LSFAILMIWVRRRREALEVAITDRSTKLTAANEDLLRQKEQLDALFELSPDAVILTDNDFDVLDFDVLRATRNSRESSGTQQKRLFPKSCALRLQKDRDRLISGNRVERENPERL